MKLSFYDLSYADLEAIIKQNNLNHSVAAILFNWHYKKKQITPCTENISAQAFAFFQENFDFSLPEIAVVHESEQAR